MWIRVCHSGKTGWSKQADDSGIWQSCVNSFILHTIWSFLQSFFSVELGLSCLKYCKSWPLIPTSISVIVRWITWVYLFFVFLVDSGDIFVSGNFCFSTLCWLPTQYFFGGLPICNNHFFLFFSATASSFSLEERTKWFSAWTICKCDECHKRLVMDVPKKNEKNRNIVLKCVGSELRNW